jgi:Flp pilus assembly pilin Flp
MENYPMIKTREHAISPRRIKGQGLTEYIIIVALIAIASIVAVSFFGSSVKASFLALGSDLIGGAKVDKVATTQASFNKAETAAKEVTTLKSYNN